MIHVWLKTKKRHNDDYVLRNLNYWLAAFSDESKYKITICNKDLPIPKYYYDNYNIIDDATLLKNNDCKKYKDSVDAGCITKYWKGAGFGLGVPYTYLKEELIYNIDSDDIIIHGDIKNILDKLENQFIKNNLKTISYDMSFSLHYLFSKIRPHHWSFGVNLSNRIWMKDTINQLLPLNNLPVVPWGVNLDYVLDYYLEHTKTPELKYVAFTTKNWLVHYEDYKVRYLEKNKVIEACMKGKSLFSPKHERTLLIE